MTTSQSPIAAPPPRDCPNDPVTRTEPRERNPWLFAILCVLIGLLPSHCVLPGPLKSNGSPATLIAVMLFGLSALGLAATRRTATTQTVRPGVMFILLYFLLNFAVYGAGITHRDTELVEGNKTRAIIWLVATVGVTLYAMTRIETTRQRNIVLGCLATVLSFAAFVAVLQNATRIDLHLLLQPPGLVINAADQGRGTGADLLTERMGAVRAIGTAISPIEFSVMAAAGVPLTIHFARNAANRNVRWLAWLGCGLALAAIPATGSRSGALALAAGLLVYMWTVKVRHLGIAILVGAAAVIVEVNLVPNTAHAMWNVIVNASEDTSIADRTSDYARVSETFHHHPLLGLGLGSTPPVEYGFLDNQWLQAIVQGGIVGAASMILLAGAAFSEPQRHCEARRLRANAIRHTHLEPCSSAS